jgi:c-di-GMP-binding flagellar brake protein YcgR
MELDEILPGCKIDVVELKNSADGSQVPESYTSSLFSVVSSDVIEMMTPQKQNSLVPLHPGERYKLVFTTDRGMVSATGAVIDRYKNSNFFITKVQLVGKLSKYQRREFFRIDCMIPVRFVPLKNEDLEGPSIVAVRTNLQTRIDKGEKISEEYGTIIDISGGGIRFTAPYPVQKDEMCLFDFDLAMKSGIRHLEIIGRCVGSENIPETEKYSHRIMFDFSKDRVSQEVIVRYIFEIERKRRRKEQEV